MQGLTAALLILTGVSSDPNHATHTASISVRVDSADRDVTDSSTNDVPAIAARWVGLYACV